jgi:hypothetical protein
MKRTSVALGLLGLVFAVAIPGASAAECLKEDFSGTEFKGVGGVYVQGVSDAQRNDPAIPPFSIVDGVLKTGDPSGTAGSDGVSTVDADPPGVRYLALTGDPAWADVTVTSRIMIDSQGTGSVALVLRAAPKTKPEDPDTWYEFRYTTGLPPVLPAEEASGIVQNENSPNVRIMKVVAGKWSRLAETDISTNTAIPDISNAGDLAGEFVTFRFKATGTLLEAFISVDGTNFTRFLEANDGELKAGRVGFNCYDYSPVFDNFVVECP